MPTRLLSVTDLPCPAGAGRTHHLTPQGRRMVCAYCTLTDEQIRNHTPLLHAATPCHCAACGDRGWGDLCAHCHLSVVVHAKR